MRHLLTLPICHAHQVLHPCRPCAKEEARHQFKNWVATIWYSAGGR